MAKTYKLTWRAEQGGRWRKKYKGKSYYFRKRPDETKAESHTRCWKEWLTKRAEIDQQADADDPDRRAWNEMIRRTAARMSELENEDTPRNRRVWSELFAQLSTYRYLIQEGVPFGFADDEERNADPSTLITVLGGGQALDEPPPPPPWEKAKRPESDEAKTISRNVERFMRRKRQQVERGQLSHGRFDALRCALEAFAGHVGGPKEITAIDSPTLSAYRDHLEKQIDLDRLRPHSARDRLAAVKQFVRWAWGEELLGLPRILESREFSIALPEQAIATFTDVEVNRLLGAASETTKLYVLLMLNCGMTQQDISDLRHDEVDWKRGRVTRKRSKTRKNGNGNGNNVPTVEYAIWPETFRLLTTYRSAHATLALTNRKGEPLKAETIVNGRVKKLDSIRSAVLRTLRKLAKDKTAPLKIDKPLKLLRKTAASKLGSNSEFARFAQHFLGHAPATVADRFYVQPNQTQFDAAVKWLGEQFATGS